MLQKWHLPGPAHYFLKICHSVCPVFPLPRVYALPLPPSYLSLLKACPLSGTTFIDEEMEIQRHEETCLQSVTLFVVKKPDFESKQIYSRAQVPTPASLTLSPRTTYLDFLVFVSMSVSSSCNKTHLMGLKKLSELILTWNS